MKNRFGFIVAIAAALFPCEAVSQQFVTLWDVGKVLTCTVTEAPSSMRERTLLIRDHDTVLMKISDLSRVIAVYPTRDLNGLLVSVWQGGSAYHVRVFAFMNSEVHTVLDVGTYFFPEMMDVDGDGTNELMIRETTDKSTNDARRIGNRLTAYKWDGKKFTRLWSRDPKKVLLAFTAQ